MSGAREGEIATVYEGVQYTLYVDGSGSTSYTRLYSV